MQYLLMQHETYTLIMIHSRSFQNSGTSGRSLPHTFRHYAGEASRLLGERESLDGIGSQERSSTLILGDTLRAAGRGITSLLIVAAVLDGINLRLVGKALATEFVIDEADDGQDNSQGEHSNVDAEAAAVAGLVVRSEDLGSVDTSDVGSHDDPIEMWLATIYAKQQASRILT